MSHIECMVLGLLNQGCRYGHELDKVIEEHNLRIWSKMTRASMYQALARIKEKGWVETDVEKIGKSPERIVYTLTNAGREALKNMLLEGLASDEFMDFRISVPISFLYTLPPQEAIAQLEKRKGARAKMLAKFPPNSASDKKFTGQKANVKLILGYYQMEIEWLEWLISELKQNADNKRGGAQDLEKSFCDTPML